nr:bifunctional enoyl-CoA hydratase/phosphate acetyltransferase [Salsuginibacillus kocurii]
MYPTTDFPNNVVVAVAGADNKSTFQVITEALKRNAGMFRLYGDEQTLNELLLEFELEREKRIRIIPARNNQESARLAVMAVHDQKADVLMKGMIPTYTLMQEVLNKEYGLRTGELLSHVGVFSVPNREKLLFLSDAAVNPTPTISQKVSITQHAVKVAQHFQVDLPKVAVIAAIETVNPDMQATVDAAMLTQMNRRGQILDCLIDGPLALDNAVSAQAALTKEVDNEVAGRADILIMPNLEIANVLYKSLVHFAGAEVGGIITGAKAPIVVTSRSDSWETKLNALAIGMKTTETVPSRRNSYESV